MYFKIFEVVDTGVKLINNFQIIHSYRFQPNFVTIFSSLFLISKIILHITGLGHAYSSITIKNLLYRSISNIVYFLKFILSDTIIIQNPDDLDTLWFMKLRKKKIKLILGSGVDVNIFKKVQNTNNLRKSIGLKNNSILFTCTTRILKEKGVLELIDAFNQITSFNSNIYLFIIGNADESNPSHISLKHLNILVNSSNIKILGHRDDIYDILNITDVFIYPSYYREGIPRSLLEALSMGLPIITTNMPGCNLTVLNNKNGFLLNKVNKNEIIYFVNKMVQNKDKFKEFGVISRNLALQKYSTNIIYRKILETY